MRRHKAIMVKITSFCVRSLRRMHRDLHCNMNGEHWDREVIGDAERKPDRAEFEMVHVTNGIRIMHSGREDIFNLYCTVQPCI